MKFTFVALWLVFESVSSSSFKNQRVRGHAASQSRNLADQACSTIEQLEFETLGNCKLNRIVKNIRLNIGDDCPHNKWKELEILTDNVGDTEAAKLAIVELCEAEQVIPQPCTTMEELDLGSLDACEIDLIGRRIKNTMGDDCPHSKWREAKLLVGMKDLNATQEYLIDECEKMKGGDDDESRDDTPPRCLEDFDIQINGCDYRSVFKGIRDELSDECSHDVQKELQLLTGTTNNDDAKEYISELCDNAWDMVDTTSYENIHPDFSNDFMNEYTDGGGYLNTETGNFQGDQSPKYKTSARSLSAGQSIDSYYESDSNGASTSRLEATFENLQNCELQSIMCCFGRDRQSNDNNGNCKSNKCDNADPADNSNLCYTEPSLTPYPQSEEGNIHCHGLAWAEDENDFISQLKFNNFFYVSMYDHMYTRGYVQNMIFDKSSNTDYVPMCSCIENMPPVSRSDCTQVDVDLTFNLFVGSNGMMEVESENDLDIEFNACEGFQYDNPNVRENNDLASYAVRLVREGKMSEETQSRMYETLVGYADPNFNNNEAVCEDKYEDLKGEEYPRWCCSHDYKTCHEQSYCNRGYNQCKECDGNWIRDDWCPADGIPKWGECTNNEEGCCGRATCQGDAYFKQCL